MASISLRLAACTGLLVSSFLPAAGRSQIAVSAPNFAMVIHGGAGTILRASMTPEMEKAYIDTLTIALRTGYAILARGGTSLDAVEATIRVMEDSPLFNAGKGAVSRPTAPTSSMRRSWMARHSGRARSRRCSA